MIKFNITAKPSSSVESLFYLTTKGASQPLTRQLDKQTNGLLSELVSQGGKLKALGTLWSIFTNKLSLHSCALGESGQLSALQFTRLLGKQAGYCKNFSTERIQLFIDELSLAGGDDEQLVRQLGLAIAEGLYQFNLYKSNATTKTTDYTIVFVSDKQLANPAGLCRELEAVVSGVYWARDLANMPPNECNPSYLAKEAKRLAASFAAQRASDTKRAKQTGKPAAASSSASLSCSVLGEKELGSLGMNAYLAVAQGSKQPPQFILLDYRGGEPKQAPLVLLGKGMTFDTGGISIKPAAAMDEMKYDMCGAASVLGTMKAISLLRPKVNVIGAVAAAENMPDAAAYRPGDIVKTMAGTTVEVLNTDAEGRMVLCDALTYLKRYKPRYLLDIATLTGACVIALGHLRSGFFANDESLAAEVDKAAAMYKDLVWRLPLDEEYMEDMKSNFADIAHMGNRSAGTITAACFLGKFATDYAWGHLDIAGTAWRSGAQKGATGRPVPLLTQFVLNSGDPSS